MALAVLFGLLFGFKVFAKEWFDLSFLLALSIPIFLGGRTALQAGGAALDLGRWGRLFLASIFVLLAISIYSGWPAQLLALRVLKAGVFLVAIGLWVHDRRIRGWKSESFLPSLVGAFSLHACLMLLQFLAPDGWRQMIYGLTGVYEIANLNSPFLKGVRVTGLTYGLAQTSVLHAFGALLCVFGACLNPRRRFVYSMAGAMNFAAILLSGRSGVLLFAVGLSCAAWAALWGGYHSWRSTLKTAVALIFISGFSVLAGWREPVFRTKVLPRLEEIWELLLYGVSSTTGNLSSMSFLPTSFGQALLGRSSESFEINPRLGSDLGFVQVMDQSGWFGLLVHVLIYAALMRRMLDPKTPRSPWLALAVFMLSAHFLFNFKEMTFFVRSQFPLLCVLFWIVVTEGWGKEPTKHAS